jgi:glucuronoarabinoxylan endo-1,4-beta-xylanase
MLHFSFVGHQKKVLQADMKINFRPTFVVIVLFFLSILSSYFAFAQPKNATVKVSKDVTFQKISGFGGFVNSPQFAYNYMTEAEIRKMWGPNSEAGYNIMRMYIPTGENNWAQAIPTAQLAKSLGIKIFASPWSMPTQWKTDNVIGSVFTDEYGVKRNVYLKEEHYADYATYLNNFVLLLRNNGVELDAISIQNEPDYQVDYAGCIFTPAQMTKFLKENRHLITCKVMAPETVGIPDNYANAFNTADVLPHFDIFAGHQYGSIQSAHKNLQTKGKEVWMSEFLINWNQNGVSRDFNWNIDAFDFAGKINEAMLANINAWIHYATKRYYAMMGDGSFGTPLSAISKRGRILSHFSKYLTGSTRTEATWNDNTGMLKGTSYLSVTGDSISIVVINGSANTYNLAVDLPFLSNSGKAITTTESANMAETAVDFAAETNRPKVLINPSSVTTLVFVKSKNLVPSQMTGQLVNYTLIDQLNPTSSSFGTNYQLTGKTVTFKVDAPLISANQHANNGYLPLNGKFNRLVFRVESISSPASYTSANTTLYYINGAGALRAHNYGTVTFNLRNNFDWILDISENVLTDGCQGIIGLYNGNYTSILTLKLNNVFLAVGGERGFRFSGPFSKSDGNLLDCLDDPSFTALNFNNVTAIPASTNLHAEAANKNAVYYVQSPDLADKSNVVVGETCSKLELKDKGEIFIRRPASMLRLLSLLFS